MLFHTPNFALLFVICFMAYPWLKQRGQNTLLVVANIIFYMYSGLLDSTLFIFVLLVNYLLARRIAGRPDWRTALAGWVGMNLLMFMSNMGLSQLLAFMARVSPQTIGEFGLRDLLVWNGLYAGLMVFYAIITRLPARASVWAAVILNLGNLATFKYANFLLGSAASVTGMLNVGWTPPIYDLILPLGISFYSFQVIAYQVDLARGQATPPRHFGQYVLFVSFFAQLIAGPILRSYQFLPQLEKRRIISMSDIKLGALFILWGLVKKVVIGDTLASFVEVGFADVAALQGLEAWLTVLCFTFQIYCDFSGYSDVAVGIGHAFGFNLPRNFHQPYLARDPREFWQRWHVTLSRWLRDYLYIPLGGNRGTEAGTYRNLFITMLLGGLWHGANWTFVIWGGLHGSWLMLHRAWSATATGKRLRETGGVPYRIVCHVGVMLMMAVTWVFFRADNFADAMTVLRGMVTFTAVGDINMPLAGFIAALMLLHIGEQRVFEDIPRASRIWHYVPAPGRGFVYASTWLLIVIFLREETPFIYFRF